MVRVRRLVAGLASVVLVVSALGASSGAVAAPLVTDPAAVSVDASGVQVSSSGADGGQPAARVTGAGGGAGSTGEAASAPAATASGAGTAASGDGTAVSGGPAKGASTSVGDGAGAGDGTAVSGGSKGTSAPSRDGGSGEAAGDGSGSEGSGAAGSGSGAGDGSGSGDGAGSGGKDDSGSGAKDDSGSGAKDDSGSGGKDDSGTDGKDDSGTEGKGGSGVGGGDAGSGGEDGSGSAEDSEAAGPGVGGGGTPGAGEGASGGEVASADGREAGDGVTSADGDDATGPGEAGPASTAPVKAAGVVPMSGPLLGISATISEDGNEHCSVDTPICFDTHHEVKPDGSTVLDDGPHNGVVAANDSVIWGITASQSTATPGPQTMVAVLPVGMEWDLTTAAASHSGRCNLGASLADVDVAGDNRKLTCSWTNDGQTQNYTIQARAWVWSVANGTEVAPKLYDTDTSTSAIVSTAWNTPGSWAVKVAAVPRTEVRMWVNYSVSTTVGGVPGAALLYETHQGWTRDSGDFRGLEALENPFTYVLDVPDGGTVSGATMLLSGVGSVSTAQQSAGDDVTVTVTGARTNAWNPTQISGMPTDFWRVSGQRITVFVPYDPYIPPGVITYLNGELKGFDPLGLSGTSNFGDGVAPGQNGVPACATSGTTQQTGSQLHCVRLPVNRTSVTANVAAMNVGALTPSLGTLFGDNRAQSEGTEKLVPGQKFTATVGVFNSGTAGAAASNTFGCVVWNAAQLSLTGQPIPVTAASIGADSFVGGGGSSMTSGFTMQYASLGLGSDQDRRDHPCGVASSQDDDVWSSDWSETTDAVRVLFDGAAEPGRGFGLRVPFARTSAAQQVDTLLPWFWQYGWSADPTTTQTSNYNLANYTTVSARGGTVQAVPALVRANTAFSQVAVGTGDVVGLTVTPFVIGPVLGPETEAKSTRVTVSLSSTCVSPVAGSLPANASLTLPDYGADELPCTADDGAPASVEFNLGDVRAEPGSVAPIPAGLPSSVGGHAVELSPLSFQVLVSPAAQDQTTVSATTVISSDSDTSPAFINAGSATDRTSSASFGIAASSAFKGFKTASTQTEGWVAPGEEFAYTVGFANTLKGDFLPGAFVDVLPFVGDVRLAPGEADGFANGGDPFELVGVEAAMWPGAQGTLEIEYSIADPAAAYATLQSAPDGSASIFDWQPWPGSGVPAGVTALRFSTSGNLRAGDGGDATIRMRAGMLGVGGVVHNNVYGAAVHDPSSPVPVQDQTFLGSISESLASTAITLAGTVQRDTDFDGILTDTVGPDSDSWWPSGVVELVTPGGDPVPHPVTGVPYTATIGAAGGFDFGLVPAGTYGLRVQGVSGMTTLAGGTLTADPAEEIADHRLVLQEVLEAPELADDPDSGTVRVPLGGQATLDVTANDTLTVPQVATVAAENIALVEGGQTGFGGSAALVPPASPGVFSQITYTAPQTWPAGVSGLSFTDSFDYSWTNALGVPGSATVRVVVQRPPVVGEGGSVIVPVTSGQGSYGLPALDVDTSGESWTVAVKGSTVPAGMAVTVTNPAKTFTVVTTGAASGPHEVVAVVTDDLQQQTEVTLTVTVQALPTATGGSVTIGESDGGGDPRSAPLYGIPQPDEALPDVAVIDYGATSVGTVTSDDGDAATASRSINLTTGVVTFAAQEPGTYLVPVSYFDNLGQEAVAEFTVRVQAVPSATGGSVRVPVTSGDAWYGLPAFDVTTTGESWSVAVKASSVPSGMTVTVNPDKSLTVVTDGAAAGEHEVVVELTDDLNQTVDVPLTVTVQAFPSAVGGSVRVPVTSGDTWYGLPALDVTTTGESWSVAVKASSVPSGMTVTVNPDKSFTVVTDGAAAGEHEVVVELTDDLHQTVDVPLTVTVQAPPSAVGSSVTVPVTTGSGVYTLPALDVETGGEVTVAVDASTLPAGVVVTKVGDGSFVVTTDHAAAGSYQVGVLVTDDLGQTITVLQTVTVRDLVVTGEQTSTVGEGKTYSFRPTVNHPDHVVSVVVSVPPGQGTVTYDPATGEVLYDARGADHGVYSFEITWTDDLGQTATLIHVVTVHEEYEPCLVPGCIPPTPPTPSPTPPVPPTPTPSPSTTQPIVVTGGTVAGGPPGVAVIGLVAAGIAVLFGVALVLGRRRDDVSR